MPVLPAICRTCGTVFRSSYTLDNVRQATLVGNTSGPCPTCGGVGEVPDGVYDIAGDVISAAAASPRAAGQMERIAEIIRAARESGASPDQVADAIEAEAPELAAIVRLLVPRTPEAFYGMLAVVLAALSLAMSLRPSHSLSPEDVARLSATAVERAMTERIETFTPRGRPQAVKQPRAKTKRKPRPAKTYGKHKRKHR